MKGKSVVVLDCTYYREEIRTVTASYKPTRKRRSPNKKEVDPASKVAVEEISLEGRKEGRSSNEQISVDPSTLKSPICPKFESRKEN